MTRIAVISAAAILALALLVAALRPAPLYPFAEISAPGGVVLRFLQEPSSDEPHCAEANRRVIAAALTPCPECAVTVARCDPAPPASPAHPLVEGRHLRIAITAPGGADLALCQAMATQIAASDPGARCLP